MKAFHRCSFRAISAETVSMKLKDSNGEAALGECGRKRKRAPTTKFVFAGEHEASDITINPFPRAMASSRFDIEGGLSLKECMDSSSCATRSKTLWLDNMVCSLEM